MSDIRPGAGDLTELKTLIAAGGSPETAAALAEALKKNSGNQTAAAQPTPEIDLNPVLNEIRSMSAQIGKLEGARRNRAEGRVRSRR